MIVPVINGLSYFIIYLTVTACSPLPTSNNNEVALAHNTPLRVAVPSPSKADECLDEYHLPVPARVAVPYSSSVPFVPAPHITRLPVLASTPVPPFSLPHLPPLLPERKFVHSSPAPVAQAFHPVLTASPPTLVQTPLEVSASPASEPVSALPGSVLDHAPVHYWQGAFPAHSIKIHPMPSPIHLIRGVNAEDCAPNTVHQQGEKVPVVESSTSHYVEPEFEEPSASVQVAPPPPPPPALPLPELLPLPSLSTPEKIVLSTAESISSPTTFIRPDLLPPAPAFVAPSSPAAFLPVQTHGSSFIHPLHSSHSAVATRPVLAPLPIPHHEPAHTLDPCLLPPPSPPAFAPAHTPALTHVPDPALTHVPLPAPVHVPVLEQVPGPHSGPLFGPVVVPDEVLSQSHGNVECDEEPVVVAQNKLFYPTQLRGTPYANNARVYK